MEIRDPLHVFVWLEPDEQRVLDSRPFQRLRHIHQLALTYLVYPGATHRRFEHSLGVLELVTRIFDVVTDNVEHDAARDVIPDGDLAIGYWRRVLQRAGPGTRGRARRPCSPCAAAGRDRASAQAGDQRGAAGLGENERVAGEP